MSVDKWPPKEDKDENLSTVEVERFKDSEKLESIDGKTIENQLIHDTKERAGEIGYKISPEVQEKIAEIKNSFINPDTTARDEIISTTNKRNATVETFTPDPAYKNIPERKKATGFKKWGVTAAMFLTGLFGAKAEGGKNTKNEDPKKPKQEQTVDTKSARKVDQAPTDPSYKKLGTEGDKTFYAKKTSGTLEKAKGGTPKADPESYMQEMITKVKSGISPQELLDKGYVTPEVAKELEQYVDVVYTQPETQKTNESFDPFQAFGRDEQVLFFNGKAVGRMFKMDRKTNLAEKNGWNEERTVAIIFGGDQGPNGKRVILDLDAPIDPTDPSRGTVQDVFNAGTTTITQAKGLEILEQKAAEFAENQEKTYDISDQELQTGTLASK
jgi:hypothetical protein